MGYSGEFYLFVWAKKSLNKGKKEILKNIRDNNILSSATSNLVAFSLVGILIFAGIIDLEEFIGNIDIIYIIAVLAIVNRIPFLPSRDLIFMWAGIELSRSLNMATASVAGMLLVSSALKKCTNLVLYLLISWYSKEPKIKNDRLNG